MTLLSPALAIDGATLALRRATEGDRARVTRDWLMSYANRAQCDRDVYERGQREIVARLWPLVQIAHRVGTEIHGWVCAEPGIVHYVYVPLDLRRHGLARAMVRAVAGEQGEHTHRRSAGLSGFAEWRFNPYRLMVTS